MRRLKQNFFKWLVVAILCLVMGFLLGKFRLTLLQDSFALLQAELQTVKLENIALTKKTAGLEASQIIDKQTIKLAAQENAKLTEQLNTLTNKLYFYERVVAPELQSSGLQIYSFSVYQDKDVQQWHYELVLMQAPKGRRLLKGQFTLNFSVLKDNQLQNIPIAKFTDRFDSAFKFKYFQTMKGVFVLPKEIQIEAVDLKLNVAGNRWHKSQQLEQHYKWQTLINDESENLAY